MQLHELDREARKGCYGCSELGMFFGVDPFRTLHDKWLQDVEGVTFPPTKRMIYGKYFEEPILRVACEEFGKNFIPSFNKTYRHPEFPRYHLVGTPDGTLEDKNDGGIEIKDLMLGQWDRYADGLPAYVELQVRGLMSVLNRPRWYVAVWRSDRLFMFTVERDMEFEDFILEYAEGEFRRYFEARVRPPIGGSEATAAWLQRKYPYHSHPDLRPATDQEIEWLRRYGRLRAEQKRLQKERDTLENQFKDAIKDREGLLWEGGKFTWRMVKGARVVDWHSLAETLMTRHLRLKDGSARDEAACQELKELHTSMKAGSRHIRFRSSEFFEEEEETDNAA